MHLRLVNYIAKLHQILIKTEVINTDWVTIKIIDNGSGIREDLRSQFFNLFLTMKEMSKGTELGRPISYEIITKKQSGKLLCNSEMGKSTEFIIQIPVRLNLLQAA
ncbi:MAG: ATP-binding protein [Microcoleaceae cyanobacterium]